VKGQRTGLFSHFVASRVFARLESSPRGSVVSGVLFVVLWIRAKAKKIFAGFQRNSTAEIHAGPQRCTGVKQDDNTRMKVG